MSEVYSSLQKVLKKEGKTRTDTCNHPTPDAYNSFQKVLKKEGKDKIERKNTNLHYIIIFAQNV